MARANIYTFAAAYAFFGVNGSKETVNMYGIVLASFLTSLATYAADFADLISYITFIFIATMYNRLFLNRKKRY